MVDGSESHPFLACEMMKKTALGYAGVQTDIVHRRRRIAFGSEHLERCGEEFFLRFMLFSRCQNKSPTVETTAYRLIGMLSSAPTKVCLGEIRGNALPKTTQRPFWSQGMSAV